MSKYHCTTCDTYFKSLEKLQEHRCSVELLNKKGMKP